MKNVSFGSTAEQIGGENAAGYYPGPISKAGADAAS